MKLSDKSRNAIMAWLESMPWWDELPYAKLQEELEEMTDEKDFWWKIYLNKERIDETE